MEQTHTSSQPRTSATPLDPRLYQILSLGALLSYGFGWLHFDVSCEQIVVTIGTALLAQYTDRLVGLPAFDPKSAHLPTLAHLLLRTNELAVSAAAALLAISSKFLFHRRNKHLFNPTNCAGRHLGSRPGWISRASGARPPGSAFSWLASEAWW